MATLRLIHWKAAEARRRIEALRSLGHSVLYNDPDGSSILTKVRAHAPQAIVIDLTRLPAHGRAVGMALRQSKATRFIPLVFVEGEPEKVARIREHLPDAIYTTWGKIRSGLRTALTHRMKDPVVPPSFGEFYAATPLARKLGVKPGMTIAVFDVPPGFDRATRDFPEDIVWQEGPARGAQLIFCFANSLNALEFHLAAAAQVDVPVWIFWPKQSSGVTTDVTQFAVRTAGADLGLVDYKVCSFDKTWSGFLLGRRRPRR